MAVSEAEVAELRREGEARGLGDIDQTLETYAEIIAFAVHTARSHAWDVNDYVEVLVRATDMWREDIREARNILQALNYPRELCQLLTALARRAPPRPPPYFSVGYQCASALHCIEHRAARDKAAADAGSPAATRRSTSG